MSKERKEDMKKINWKLIEETRERNEKIFAGIENGELWTKVNGHKFVWRKGIWKIVG